MCHVGLSDFNPMVCTAFDSNTVRFQEPANHRAPFQQLLRLPPETMVLLSSGSGAAIAQAIDVTGSMVSFTLC